MKTPIVIAALALLTLGAGCGHSYATPVVVVHPEYGDVAWIVEDGGRVLRCTNAPDRPLCRRANVD